MEVSYPWGSWRYIKIAQDVSTTDEEYAGKEDLTILVEIRGRISRSVCLFRPALSVCSGLCNSVNADPERRTAVRRKKTPAESPMGRD